MWLMECWEGGMAPRSAGKLRFKGVHDSVGEYGLITAIVLLNQIRQGCPEGIEENTIHRYLVIRWGSDAVRLQELNPRPSKAVAHLQDEVFAVHIDTPADEVLALLEGESVCDLRAGRPAGEVGLGATVSQSASMDCACGRIPFPPPPPPVE